jgi:DNA (cytosine-5)-methyltransferase 1
VKPRLLDLFCGAGGCSVGYHRAGFDVVGVDHHRSRGIRSSSTAPTHPVREGLRRVVRAWDLPYVIENVPGAPLVNAIMLCGSSFGLDVRRHRLFESNVGIMALPCAHGLQTPRFRSLDSRMAGKLATVVGVHGHLNYPGEFALRCEAMGIDWMTNAELSQAIPPAYTEHIGHYLLAELTARATA